tara:strand:- start:390 stop:695 length:306 start_codon:yes stop_codon:yes gene_type:complete
MCVFNNLPEEILKYIYKIALTKIHINSVLYLIKHFKSITQNKNKNQTKKIYECEIFYMYYYKYLYLIKHSPIKITKNEQLQHNYIIYHNFWCIDYDICNIS